MSLTELELQAETTGEDPVRVIEGRSPWVLARRLRQDKVAVASLAVIVLLALLAIGHMILSQATRDKTCVRGVKDNRRDVVGSRPGLCSAGPGSTA